MRSARTFCLLVGLGLGCFGRANELQLGGETNWFGWCASDSDCLAGSCVCGVCTTECSVEEPSCAGAPAGSECVPASSESFPGQCDSGAPSGACLVPCEGGVCGSLQTCVNGWCTPLTLGPEGGSAALGTHLCEDNPAFSFSGQWTVRTPEELEMLRGCREIAGILLYVDTRKIQSLEPLSELRSAFTDLLIGPRVRGPAVH